MNDRETISMEQPSLKAGILIIGNEVLDGIVLDTNANWMEQRFVELGVEVRRVVSVRDELEEIGSGLDFLTDHCDVVVTSGGLGPTHDDMTLKAIASHLGLELEENPEALAIVERQYRLLHERGIISNGDLTESRRKMAHIPKGSVPLDNRVGGAPGVMLRVGKSTIFCLPGVPAELKDIWKSSVEPWLKNHVVGRYYQEIVEFEVIDESTFSPYIDEVMTEFPGIWIKSLPKRYGSTRVMRVWVSCRSDDEEEVKQKVKDAIKNLQSVSHARIRDVKT